MYDRYSVCIYDSCHAKTQYWDTWPLYGHLSHLPLAHISNFLARACPSRVFDNTAEHANLVSCRKHAHKVVSHKWIGCLEAFLLKIDFRSESLVRKMPVDLGAMQRHIDSLNLQISIASPIAIILATNREPSRILIWKYYHLIRADMQAAFFNIWQLGRLFMRHESLVARNQASASDEIDELLSMIRRAHV